MVQRTALFSAYDKTGVAGFAQNLREMNWQLMASGGTKEHLTGAGLPVRDVAEIVGPSIFGHRVVTLSREIHAALLAQNTSADLAELGRIGVPRIDLVYVDLYPLRAEIDREGCTLASVIEKTDIGGPTLLRSAAKGRRYVLSGAEQFPVVLEFLRRSVSCEPPEEVREAFISSLVASAEKLCSRYSKLSGDFHDRRGARFQSIEQILKNWLD